MSDIDMQATSPPRVLLAEDSPVNAIVIAKQLDCLGFACTIAEDGEQAWRALQGQRFVALLTDCDMPVLDGYSLAMRIRAEPAFGTLPIIALSARPDAAQQARCIAAGMDACLPKPVSNAALAGALSASTAACRAKPVANAARNDLDALSAVFPDPQALAGLLAQFVRTARADLNALERAHAAGTPVPFAKLLHRFVGSLQMLNQHEVADALETWHRSGRLPLDDDYAQLQFRILSVIERVEARLQHLPPPR